MNSVNINKFNYPIVGYAIAVGIKINMTLINPISANVRLPILFIKHRIHTVISFNYFKR